MASLQKKKHYQVSLIRDEVKRYVEVIKRIVEVFITPWKDKKRDNPLLAPKISESIFGNLEVIVKLEKTFLEDLDKLLGSEVFDRTGAIKAIIGQKSGYFKLYNSYATNLRNSIAVLFDQLGQNNKFASFVASGEKKLLKEFKHNMSALVLPPTSAHNRFVDFAAILQGRFATSYLYHDLPSLLVVPLHFLPRFHRLLANLGAVLPAQDPDAPIIAELERQSQMRLDTLTQDVENVRRVAEMQLLLIFPPGFINISNVDPLTYVEHRRLVKEGMLKDIRQSEARLVYVLLYSDIILFTTKKDKEETEGHKLVVQRVESLGAIRAEDQELGNDHNGFQIRVADTVIMLHASSPSAKDDWMRSLRTSIQLAQASGPKDSSLSEEEVINDFGSILKALATNHITRLELPDDCLNSNDSISFLSCLSANKSLTFLSLAGSQIGDTGMPTISSWLQKTQTLRTFNLSRNRLSHLGVSLLSDALRSNDSLTSLDLSSNPIGTLGLYALVTGLIWNNSIEVLSLSDTNLSPMSSTSLVLLFETNKTLQSIDMRDNKLLTEGSLSSAAATINSSGCKISNFSSDNKAFLDMIQQTLDYNKALREREGKSPTKWNEEVYLQKPDALDMKNYGFVDITEPLMNKINAKQRGLRPLTTVVTLQLDYNSLTSLSPEAILPLSENLRELSLHHNQISTPPDLYALAPHLTYLDLSENSLHEFPKSLAHLRSLSHLNLGCNLISELPTECVAALRGMKALRQLLLHKNHLMHVPRALFSLHNLNLFSVAGNPSIPVTKQKIFEAWASRATMLDFSNLGLIFLPRDIEYLTSLVELILRDNQLKELPPQIGRLPSLEVLDISRNQIAVLPRQLVDAPKLKIVRLAGTPAAALMGDLLTGPELHRRLAAQAHPAPARCPRLKLLLVGKANVGKTSVFKSLKASKKTTGISALLPKRGGEGGNLSPASMIFGGLLSPASPVTQLSTDGIDMEEWAPPVTEGSPVSFNVFDFAGQDVYYATHQFFISPRSVFLVVFDMKKVGDGDDEYASILYWLQCIEARGSACPVVLVGTHLDEVSSDHVQAIQTHLRQMYFGKFPNVKEFVAVNAKSSKNVPNLLRLVVSLAQQDPSQQELVPASFLQLESLIVAERKQHTAVVTLGELCEWGRCCGVRAGEESAAVRWLHELGTVVHWGSGVHDDLVILDPNWLVRLLCTLVTTKANFVSNGILLRKNLDMIWKAPDFPMHLHEVLLSVLQKFELLFLLPDGVSFLLPTLLNNDRPKELEIPSVYRLERIYQFTFMPFGLFSRLMIRIIHFMDPKLYWRNGILATSHHTSAFVEFQPATLQLEVQVWGARPAKYLRFVMDTIDVLARGWYAGVGCQVLVACSCHACNPHPSVTAPPSRPTAQEDIDESLFPNAFGTLRAFIKRQQQASVAPRALIPYREFEDAVLTGKLHMTCPNGGKIEVPYATPELTLTDISILRIGYNELQFMEQIGKGGFGTVWRAKLKGQLVAVKKLGLDDAHLENHEDQIHMLREFRREVWLSSTLTHKCIVSLTAFCTNPSCMVLEYLPHGNLYNHMKKVGESGMTWEFKIKIAINIAEALQFLHSQNPKILHRDLKSPNVLLLTLDQRQDVVCKVSDFGESRVIATTGAGRDNLANPVWLAPEVIRRSGGEYTEKADIFSFGIILWELVTCQRPYQEYPVAKSTWVSKFEDEIVDGLRPTIPSDCPKEIRDLIERCWNGDPSKRPMVDEVHATLLDFQMFLPHMSFPQKQPPKELPKLSIPSPIPPATLKHSNSQPIISSSLLPPSSSPRLTSHPTSPTLSSPSPSLSPSSSSSPSLSPSFHSTPNTPTKSPGLVPRFPPVAAKPFALEGTGKVPKRNSLPDPVKQDPTQSPAQASTQGPATPQEKIERMRTIIRRVLERTIEYLAGIQTNIENAESLQELTQLGSGAKLLYLGAKKLDTLSSTIPKAPKSPRAAGSTAPASESPAPQKRSPASTALTIPPVTRDARFNSTVINNTTINNTNINITINSPPHSSHDLITDAITNAINEVMNSTNPVTPSDTHTPPSPTYTSTPRPSQEREKMETLKRRLSSVNSDACGIMRHMLALALDETTDLPTLMEMAKLVMAMKQQNVS